MKELNRALMTRKVRKFTSGYLEKARAQEEAQKERLERMLEQLGKPIDNDLLTGYGQRDHKSFRQTVYEKQLQQMADQLNVLNYKEEK